MTTTVSDPTAPIASYPPDLMRSDLDQGSLVAAMRTQEEQSLITIIPRKSQDLRWFQFITLRDQRQGRIANWERSRARRESNPQPSDP